MSNQVMHRNRQDRNGISKYKTPGINIKTIALGVISILAYNANLNAALQTAWVKKVVCAIINEFNASRIKCFIDGKTLGSLGEHTIASQLYEMGKEFGRDKDFIQKRRSLCEKIIAECQNRSQGNPFNVFSIQNKIRENDEIDNNKKENIERKKFLCLLEKHNTVINDIYIQQYWK